MDALFDLSLDLIVWLQTAYPGLQSLMTWVSVLGQFEIYLMLILGLYWCIDKRAGVHLAYLLGLTYVLINMGKHFGREPRPFWLDETLNVAETGGYGIPSGHTGAATVTYLYLAYWAKRRWAWVLAAVGIFVMGLSRIYLGQHFLHDILAGFVVAVMVLAGYWVWLRQAEHRFQNQILGRRFWTAVAVPAVLGGIYFLGLLLLGTPDNTVPWAGVIPIAEFVTLEDMTAALGVLLGLGTGFILEGSRVHFDVVGEWWMRLLRYVCGLAVTLLVLYGLRWLIGAVLPEDASLWIVLGLRFVRYTLVALVATFYLPMLFVKVGLADSLPAPTLEVVAPRPNPLHGPRKKESS
jgi:membrane-associated phospholipid phosphatase